MDNPMPHPPFPHPDSKVLGVIFQNAQEALDNGEEPRAVIINAAVNAWYEGHVEGEDYCTGCTFRGDHPEDRDQLRASQ